MTDIGEPLLRREADALPEILRAPVHLWLDRLHEAGHTLPDVILQSDVLRGQLIRLVASSEYAGSLNWPWATDAHRMVEIRTKKALRRIDQKPRLQYLVSRCAAARI